MGENGLIERPQAENKNSPCDPDLWPYELKKRAVSGK